jgi:uncharacterized SAM-binding protein YcdF (DUF218 family)
MAVWGRVAGGLLLLGAVALGVTLARRPLLQAAGDFLVVEDPLARADAVIAVSGDGEERVRTASELLLQGYGRLLILSGGPGGGTGSTDQLVQYARRSGVPDPLILRDEGATSTLENARGSARLMRAHGLSTGILVTSPYHMRRAIIIFRSVFRAQRLSVRAYPARNSFFEVREWWTRRQDRELVEREYLKLAAFLIGIH